MSDYERICKILDNQGIFYEGDLIDQDMINSLQYVATIVEIENEFSVEIPDQYLVNNILTSISDVINLISSGDN